MSSEYIADRLKTGVIHGFFNEIYRHLYRSFWAKIENIGGFPSKYTNLGKHITLIDMTLYVLFLES